jgi:RNA polymerase-binding transcription factor DksA
MAAETTQKRTDLDIEYFRGRLLDEKRLAEETIEATRRQEGSPGVTPGGDATVEGEGDPANNEGMGTVGHANRDELSSGADNHPADVATELFQREEDMALIQNAREVVSRIDRALAKIDEGTYGLSDRSGEPIPAERLEVLPYATLTTEEQEIQELS